VAFAGIITAMVTPFDESGGFAEDAAGRLMGHLLSNGSDGLVLAGTTGEGPTLTDDEMSALWQIGAEVSGDAPCIAGTGTNDTRHTIELTERAAEAGADGALVVTPYYNKPTRRGLIEHFRAVAAATDLPIVLYNIPSRTALDMPNDLLRELAEIETVVAVKQARYEDVEPIEGLDLLAGNDDMVAEVLDLGGPGGITVMSHLVGPEMRRLVDEPENRAEINASLQPIFAMHDVATNPIPVKTAMALLGHDVGGLRLPLTAASEEEGDRIRSILEGQGLLEKV
jgi:4-hydroxy-tetrahydrodipicolinate synthase